MYQSRIPHIRQELDKACVKGLTLSSEHVLGVSNSRVPLEEGTLERSGSTVVVEKDLEAVIFYDTVYAVVQHEALDFHHDPGREAKFLEKSLLESTDTFPEITAAQVKRALS
jgi:hypothetical protein